MPPYCHTNRANRQARPGNWRVVTRMTDNRLPTMNNPLLKMQPYAAFSSDYHKACTAAAHA
jgi:hypothetical protein